MRIPKWLRTNKGEVTSQLLLKLIVAVLLIAMGVSALQNVNANTALTVDQAITFLDSHGYVAYADLAGNWHVTGDADVDGDLNVDGSVVVDGSVTATSGNFTTSLYSANYQVPKAMGTPDYVVGVNTATDDVPGATGYWVKSGATGRIVYTNVDASTAIQWAIDNLPVNTTVVEASKMGHIQYTDGLFTISTTINIRTSYVRLVGASMGGTRLKLGADVSLYSVETGRVLIEIANQLLDGNSSAYSATSHGLVALGDDVHITNRIMLDHVRIANFKGSGLYLDRVQDCTFNVVDIDVCGNATGGTEKPSVYVDGTGTVLASSNVFNRVSIHSAPWEFAYLGPYARFNDLLNTKLDALGIAGATNGFHISGGGNRISGGYSWTNNATVFLLDNVDTLPDNLIEGWVGVEQAGAPVTRAVWSQASTSTRNKVIHSKFTGFWRTLDLQLNEGIFDDVVSVGSTDKDVYVSGNNNRFTNCNLPGTVGNDGTGNRFSHNIGYVTENSGSSTGTGAQQTIAHGLSFTPTTAQIMLWDIEVGAAPYHSAAPDATNIYVTALVNQDWGWATVGK